MSDDPETKTEEPTGKRLGDARSKGQVAQSREIAHTVLDLQVDQTLGLKELPVAEAQIRPRADTV